MTRFLPTVSKLSATLLAAGVLAAPAIAERAVSHTVNFTFDEAQLTTVEGATSVLDDLNKQAESACTSTTPILRTEQVDELCVEDVMRQAVIAINSAPLTEAYNIAEGRQIAPSIRAAAATTILQE